MSTWAQGRPAVNSRRNAPAKSPPPQRTQSCWARSATLEEVIRCFISSGIGIGQHASPAVSEAASTWATTSSLPMTPATWSPSATTMWPVRVATSTMRSGSTSVARTSASPRTRRPSASVLKISTVVPPYIRRTSPGRVAEPESMFSAIGTKVETLTGRSRRAMASVAWTTAAAPAMSDFISCIEPAGLMLRPPESKVMPLPTRARCGASFGRPLGV